MADDPKTQLDAEPPAGPDDHPSSPASSADFAEQNKKSGKKLIIVIVGSFIFAWASIPLYRIVCDQIDPGGTTWRNGSTDTYSDVEVDKTRKVRVRFASNVNEQLPWSFKPLTGRVEVHPGEQKLVKFHAKNLDPQHAITGKAVYDINPPEAGQYFKKIECFCFVEQELAAGEEMDMPLVFWFEPDMPDHIKEVTLAYTFFNADSSLKRSLQKQESARLDLKGAPK